MAHQTNQPAQLRKRLSQPPYVLALVFTFFFLSSTFQGIHTNEGTFPDLLHCLIYFLIAFTFLGPSINNNRKLFYITALYTLIFTIFLALSAAVIDLCLPPHLQHNSPDSIWPYVIPFSFLPMFIVATHQWCITIRNRITTGQWITESAAPTHPAAP